MEKKESVGEDPFLEREAQKYESPVPSREFILAHLTEAGQPVKRKVLMEHFGIADDPELVEGFRRRLKAMIRDGQIFKTPKGVVPIIESETRQGIVVLERDGEGYVRVNTGSSPEEKINLRGASLRGLYEGDEVEVQLIQVDQTGRLAGRLLQILKPVTPYAVGRLIRSGEHYEAIPFDRKIFRNITVPQAHKGEAKEGDIVYLEILRDEKYQYHPGGVGKVIELLGDISSPGIEVKMAVRKFDVPEIWPTAVLKACEKLSPVVKPGKEPRRDLTSLNLVTIDGEDAKDFDDAVLCEPRKGGWRLLVAIADVSFYVKPGSSLDQEAKHRGNSTYFPGCVIPMLPEILSNELCSLKPQVPRLCFVCEMDISAKGEIEHFDFYRGIMHSKARLTYTEVAEIIAGNAALRAQYGELTGALESLHDLYQALHGHRQIRGAIDFDTVETRILFDRGGKINSIVPQVRNVAHKMIEESMLAANVCAAKFIQKHKYDTLFRIHDRPPQEKLKSLREFLSELGLDLPGQSEPTAKDYSKLLSSVQDREDKHMIETVMLRSLSQAQYSPKNIGHFGLAYGSYTHFTSPIRRYPDLIVHRTIAEILENKGKTPTTLTEKDLEGLGTHCSETERRSDDATRDATLALKCHYMQDKIGEEYTGMITGVASFGIFIELKSIYIEGMVHVTGLGDEYFNFDAAHHRMVGDHTRKVYRLGDTVMVRVVRVDVEMKRIDLELLDQPPGRARGSRNAQQSPRTPKAPKKAKAPKASTPVAEKKKKRKNKRSKRKKVENKK